MRELNRQLSDDTVLHRIMKLLKAQNRRRINAE